MKHKSSSALGVLFFLSVFVIIYGSLFPFRFEIPSVLPALALNGDLHIEFADMLGNIMLFVPAGLFGTLLARDDRRNVVLVLILVLAIAIGVQAAQIFLPQRVASLSDIFFNMIGISVGYLVARATNLTALQGYFRRDHPILIPVLLLVAFAIYQLIPFLPTLDWGRFTRNIDRVLRASSTFNLVDLIYYTAYWFAVAVIAGRVVSKERLVRVLITAILAVFALRVLIIFNNPSLAQFLGSGLGLGLFILLPLDERRRMVLAATMITAVIIHSGLTPWEPRAAARPLSLTPFWGFLTGGMLGNFQTLGEKLFLYGSTLYLLSAAGIRGRYAVTGLAFILLMIELAQTQLRAGTPEITDPLIAIILGLVLSRAAHK